MLIINKYFPFKGFSVMALFPFIFIRGEYYDTATIEKLDIAIRHENFHLRQQLELPFGIFFIFYGLFYLLGLIRYRSHKDAYMNIPFEREAHCNDKNREHIWEWYGWLKYLI
jgi:hypothetical protein